MGLSLRIGYSPYTRSLIAPGDRRRFGAFARARGLPFELADPERSYDLVVVSTAGDVVSWADSRRKADKVVFDLCDAYLELPPGLKDTARGVGKYLLGDLGRPVWSYRGAVERLCRRADAVICTTDEQKSSIERFCPNVHVILDISEDSLRDTKIDYELGDTLNIFWEGLPVNLRYFGLISDTLRELSRARPVAMHIATLLQFGRWSRRIGTVQTKSLTRQLFDHAYVYEWNEIMLSRIAAHCDLGVIPLDIRDPLAAGKPENKLLWMWRVGLPTLTTRTPAYARAMRAVGIEATCTTPAEWEIRLNEYARDEQLRRRTGERGRAYALREHSPEQTLARWDEVLSSIGLS